MVIAVAIGQDCRDTYLGEPPGEHALSTTRDKSSPMPLLLVPYHDEPRGT